MYFLSPDCFYFFEEGFAKYPFNSEKKTLMSDRFLLKFFVLDISTS